MSLLSRLAVQAARAYGILSARSTNVSADYLVVAGGGGGGYDEAGGGGAGGYQTSTFTLSTLNTYSITVGAGGNGATSAVRGSNGSDSTVSGTGLSTVTSIGGGGGGSFTNTTGASGGSGGGGRSRNSAAGGSGTVGQGNNGGNGASGASDRGGGGGGGASAVGGTGSGNTGAAGGAGSASSISGSSVTYAGGGGGGGTTGGAGGAGGGGAGGGPSDPVAGTANRGGGGGGGDGGAGTLQAGANGGSGIVIISYTATEPKFVGGTITTSGGKQIHTFTSSGTLSPITPITASYLVVAGGGGGGWRGGAGAGGYQTSSTTLYSGATYVVTVGAGGSASVANDGASGGDGSNSVLSGTGITTVTSTGGGGGGGSNLAGRNGGSGGGGGVNNNQSTVYNGGTGTSGQGTNGGNTFQPTGAATSNGGGGGGATSAGSNASAAGTGGNGGAGTASSISGSSVTYAGGGGGGATSTGGTGGSGGGGAGSNSSVAGVPGTVNLGAGGGGGGLGKNAGTGGSGIVIISYAGSQVFNGGLVTTSGGNTIHTFTSTGALTPLTNNLNNSLRFRSSASAYLNRTPTVAGNGQKFTISTWCKIGAIDTANKTGLQAYSGSANTDTTTLLFYINGGSNVLSIGGASWGCDTTAVFRDPSAWYHIVIAVDTTQATSANRAKIYVNGNQQTLNSPTYPSLNLVTPMNQAVIHNIGRRGSAPDRYFDGYLADFYVIDGEALEPYYFGNNDANGVWKPIQYKGTYGTNGFYLNFADTSALTTSSNAGLGKDTSGNGNYWTTNNISITSGSTYDPMLDVPTNTSATVANYCVLNPLGKRRTVTQVATFSEANLKATFPNAAGNATFAIGTFGVTSGKWYWEIPVVTRATELVIGIGNTGTLDETNGGAGYQATNGAISGFTTNPPAGASYTSGDIIGVALDVDAGTCAFYKNNSLQGTGTGLLSTPQPWVQGNTNDVINANFGQRPFSYTPPTGFVALNTFNLPTPTILQGNKYMDATLYTGTGTALNVVNAGQFKPDFVWAKNRSAADSSGLYDSVRGVDKRLISNSTAAEDTSSGVSAFNSNGFSLGTAANYNTSGNNFVGWQWQAGQGSTSSNTSGSITSTVSVNTTAGFSVVTWANTSTNATIGHGLGVAPKMIIAKNRTGTADSWLVYHSALGATKFLRLESTAAEATNIVVWNNTAPTSTVFSIGTGLVTGNFVAYCWAEIAGFSKFGSYTGNGSTDGPFVYLGFRPKYVMVKPTSTTGSWQIEDTSRSPTNVMDQRLFAEDSAAETVNGNGLIDYLSNGFKPRVNHPGNNGSGVTYIYMAFAENPTKISNAR